MRLSDCKIARMLKGQKKHVSFHTPGHKRAGADITELSYSDNLYSPRGVIREAEEDIARILGAARSFILTDGSTSGVHAVLAAFRAAGCNRIAVPEFSHISVLNGCEILGLTPVWIKQERKDGIPLPPRAEAIVRALEEADALLLTSPDYYGNFSPLREAAQACGAAGKPFGVDGAHGAHLHFTEFHAGRYADLWVDGVHKSLPALTQGAVVSAKTEKWAGLLEKSTALFRTTSPSYPIMASVEYAVKYPRNAEIEREAEELKKRLGAYPNGDWSKIVLFFGDCADEAQTFLERRGVYPEFNDGNYLEFYLSPCTKKGELRRLEKLLKGLPRGARREIPREGCYACMTEGREASVQETEEE